MPSFQQMLAGRCTKLPVFQLVPGQSLTAGYFLIQVEPAIRHGLRRVDKQQCASCHDRAGAYVLFNGHGL